MKKIILVLISLILILGIDSCKKNPLNITPDGRISLEDVFKDQIKTEAFLNTIYTSIPAYFVYYPNYLFLSTLTDESEDASIGYVNFMPQQWISGALSTTNNPLGILDYSTWWHAIEMCNLFLANIDAANISSPTSRNRFKGEAFALRAFFYWELVKQYGPMPVVHAPFSANFDYTSLKRGDFQTDIDSIVADCDAAIANPDLPLRIDVESERGRFTKGVAYAIKSESLLYNASPLWNPNNDQAKWQAASDAGKQALTALTESGTYQLYPDYGDYFIKTSDISTNPVDKETIYEVPSNGGLLSIVNEIPSLMVYGIGIRAGACPSQELIDSYDMQATGEPPIKGYSDADHLQPIINTSSGYDEHNPYVGRDPRFYASIWYNGAYFGNILGVPHTMEIYEGGSDHLTKTPDWNYTPTGYYLRKFINPLMIPNQLTEARDKKYRLAEIYLNYAEAENEANGPSQDVYDAINIIRDRAHMPDLPAGLSQDEMRTRIRNERRVELAFEEHRFWDVRRWKILTQTDKFVTGMDITKNTDGSFNYKRFVAQRRENGWQDKYLLFPIPLTDAGLIPDFSQNQNPGW